MANSHYKKVIISADASEIRAQEFKCEGFQPHTDGTVPNANSIAEIANLSSSDVADFLVDDFIEIPWYAADTRPFSSYEYYQYYPLDDDLIGWQSPYVLTDPQTQEETEFSYLSEAIESGIQVQGSSYIKTVALEGNVLTAQDHQGNTGKAAKADYLVGSLYTHEAPNPNLIKDVTVQTSDAMVTYAFAHQATGSAVQKGYTAGAINIINDPNCLDIHRPASAKASSSVQVRATYTPDPRATQYCLSGYIRASNNISNTGSIWDTQIAGSAPGSHKLTPKENDFWESLSKQNNSRVLTGFCPTTLSSGAPSSAFHLDTSVMPITGEYDFPYTTYEGNKACVIPTGNWQRFFLVWKITDTAAAQNVNTIAININPQSGSEWNLRLAGLKFESNADYPTRYVSWKAGPSNALYREVSSAAFVLPTTSDVTLIYSKKALGFDSHMANLDSLKIYDDDSYTKATHVISWGTRGKTTSRTLSVLKDTALIAFSSTGNADFRTSFRIQGTSLKIDQSVCTLIASSSTGNADFRTSFFNESLYVVRIQGTSLKIDQSTRNPHHSTKGDGNLYQISTTIPAGTYRKLLFEAPATYKNLMIIPGSISDKERDQVLYTYLHIAREDTESTGNGVTCYAPSLGEGPVYSEETY